MRSLNKMPLCGFNKQMLDGCKNFHLGLVEHGIIERSKKKNQSLEKTIENELNDMKRFQKEIPNIENPEIKEITDSLTKYACAFYKLIDKQGIENYKETINFLNNFYFKMDEKFYNELEGKPEDMKELALYLNEISKK